MNNVNRLSVCVALLMLAACRDPGPSSDAVPAEAAPAPVAAPSESVPTAAAPPALVSELRAPLPGGIQALPFAFHVSVDREVDGRDGARAREVGLELLGASAEEANAALATLMQQAGATIDSREEQGSAIRTVYALADGSKALVWARTGAPRGERYALQQPDATGTIYLAWPFVTP